MILHESAPSGATAEQPVPGQTLSLRALVGSGDRIGVFVLPFLVAAAVLAIAFPSVIHLGGLPTWLDVLSAIGLAVGLVGWGWSVALILTRVRAGDLVTTGPYAVVKHPLYTSVGLLVLPCLGLLLDTWVGIALGVALYIVSRRFAPAEEAALAQRFGPEWVAYCRRVRLPWL
jgi:protein-S-isoprenylcysteine O-methyltransferase Ste14